LLTALWAAPPSFLPPAVQAAKAARVEVPHTDKQKLQSYNTTRVSTAIPLTAICMAASYSFIQEFPLETETL